MAERSTVNSKNTIGKKDMMSCGYSTDSMQEQQRGSPEYPVNKAIEMCECLIDINFKQLVITIGLPHLVF